MAVIASLHIYPLKGAAGCALVRSPVGERGLRHDRRFMLASDNGQFVSQRNCPRLALVRPMIANDLLRIECAAGAVAVPLDPTDERRTTVTVWDDTVEAVLISSEADSLLSQFLATPCRLVWMPHDAHRLTDPKRGDPRRSVSFADAAPVLLTTDATLEDLNRRLRDVAASQIPMNRFRPNIVVGQAAVGEDDTWGTIAIGSACFRGTNACRRCQVVTIDQATAELCGPEPLRTLATYRREDQAVTFGQHLLVDVCGTIGVGDDIRVLTRRS